MKIKAIIFFIPLFSLACSLISVTAAPPVTAALRTDRKASPTKMPVAAVSPTPTLMRVCTDIPDGNLRVRLDAGVQYAVLDLLPEGAQVKVTARKSALDGSVWAKIQTLPQGWVNANYLCEEGNRES